MKKILFFIFMFIPLKTVCAAPELSAKCACLMVQETGEIIYEKNADLKTSMASTTKIMTALTAIESCSLSEEAVVSENAAMQEGSSAYLGIGEKIPIEELLYGLMLNSGNDAAVVIAEHISGSAGNFAVKMTQRANEIGAVNTSFKNPNGLDEEGHYTTASDLALIACEAMKNEDFRKIVLTQVHKTDYSAGTLYFTNHNKLLKNYEGCIGIKTGYTKKSGRCLVSAAENNGKTLVCVTLDAPDDWNDHKKMLDYGFEKTKLKTVVSEGQIMKRMNTIDGKVINIITEQGFSFHTAADKINSEIVLHTIDVVDGSINKGDKLGECDIYVNGRKVNTINLVAGEMYIKEEKKTFLTNFIKMLDKYFPL